jgi:carbon-monoxide dehydrogenase medium subunit
MARAGGDIVKPALFDYVAPATLDEAIAALGDDPNARPLAGGQSLIAALNFRLAIPTKLVDLRLIPELRGIEVTNGHIRVGAMTRHRDLELSEDAHGANPLVREVLGNVAHVAVRNRGTIGGNISHADAASEIPALLTALDGAIEVRGPNGERTIPAGEFFRFHMTTALEQGEVVTSVIIPAMPPDSGGAFLEHTRRKGDYAISGVCAVITLDGSGVCTEARLAGCGITSRAVRLTAAEKALTGATPDDETILRAGEAATEHVDIGDDLNASLAYRKQLTATLVARATKVAADRAKNGAW